jgi:hypothetical protein
MKKLTVAMLVLLCAGVLFATQSRVSTMGGSVAMLPDDDNNIGLFPQQVNNWTMARFEGVQTGAADYMLVVGKKGKKYGFYGGLGEQDDFLNMIKSLSSTSAYQIGIRFGTVNDVDETDNKEPSPGNSSSELSNKYTNIGVLLKYGKTTGKKELVIGGGYMSGPGAINSLPAGIYGDYEYTEIMNKDTTNNVGSANMSAWGVGAALRHPKSCLIFDNIFKYAFFGMGSMASEYELVEPKKSEMEDQETSGMLATVGFLCYNNAQISGNSVLAYGLGFDVNYMSVTMKDKLTKNKMEGSNIIVGGPVLRVGLEADLKLVKLRFGFTRSIDLYSTQTTTMTYPSGTEKDKDEEKSSGIGQGGSYTFASGVGMAFGNLQVDLIFNNNFWVTGPQMIFGNVNNNLGVRADVIYTFKSKK